MNRKKTNTTAELWQITQKWLLLLGNKPNTGYCREEITTHPDYPAITAVTDFLDSGNMQYQAVKADASCIHEFNYPLLAHIRQPGLEYMYIIANTGEWDKQKEITQHWSGVTIFPGKKSFWKNEQNSIYQKNAFKNKAIATALTAAGVGLLAATAIIYRLPTLSIGFGLLSLAGLITGIFLLGTELGYQSNIVKQVCGAVSEGGCEKVLKSKYANGVFGITPATASVLYFATQFALYLVHPFFAGYLNNLLLVAFAGIIVAGWSMYVQAVKLKQWCALCLGIGAVLIFQACIALLILAYGKLFTLAPVPFLVFAAVSILLALVVLPVKGLIQTNTSNRQKLAELKKWKTDAGLFITLLRQEQQVETTVWQNDLVMGHPEAPVLITVGCNPYCAPCAKAHVQIDNLLHRFAGKIKVQVRLLCTSENENDKKTIAVKAILQKAAADNGKDELQQMLADWFAWMDLEKWNAKWQPDNSIDITSGLHDHNKWMDKKTIQVTPTFFINGHKLPGRYSLQDIEILIPQLAEELTGEAVK